MWKLALVSTVFSSLFGLLIQSNNNLYANPHCGLRIVNETNPNAYAIHPVWKDMQYDESCSNNMQQYISQQYSNNMEYKIAGYIRYILAFLGAVSVIYGIYQAGIKKVPSAFTTGLVTTSLILGTTHFENDILDLNGALLHHGGGAAGIGGEYGTSSSDGLAVTVTTNLLLFTTALMVDHIPNDPNKWIMVGMAPIFYFKGLQQVKSAHDFGHSQNDTTLMSWKNAWPYSQKRRAFCHCIVHHDTGYNLMGDAVLDPLFDKSMQIYGFLHRSLVGPSVDSVSHYVLKSVYTLVTRYIGILLLCALKNGIVNIQDQMVRMIYYLQLKVISGNKKY